MTEEIKTYGPDDFDQAFKRKKRRNQRKHQQARAEQEERCPFNEDE